MTYVKVIRELFFLPVENQSINIIIIIIVLWSPTDNTFAIMKRWPRINKAMSDRRSGYFGRVNSLDVSFQYLEHKKKSAL